jgi:DNA primase
MGVVDEVKERLDIVDVISAYLPLKKAGRSFKGLCPFHTEKTPSFIVFPDTQSWHCFGACGTGGDIFTFIMRRENMEFGEALRLLAGRAGVELEPRDEAQELAGKAKERLQRLNVLAAEYFHYLLLNSPEGAKSREYLARRAVSDETREAFQLGCARDDWQALGSHLNAKGYSWADLLGAGLVVERESGGYYDRFRGRLVFPIRDVRGHVVGFGARALDDSLPKYLNSPQTPLFDKSSILYGVDQAKNAIREQGLAVIVEGYMDVLLAHQYGRKNVVASMGTALTDKQIRVLKKLTKKLVLALDPDAAGEEATLRGLDAAKEGFDYRSVPVPTPRGLIRYQEQLDADIRVTTLPAGQDPDEVIKADVARWDALIAAALPVVDYYMRTLVGKFDLKSPKDKVVAAREVLPLIREVSSSVERSHYVQELARMLRVDERVLLQEMEGKPQAQRAAPSVEERYGRLSSQHGMNMDAEKYVLVLLRRRPDLLALMNAGLTGLGLGQLSAEDFAQVEERALFELMARHIERYNGLDADRVYEEAEAHLRQALDEVLALADRAASLPEEQTELDALRCALRLRQTHLLRQNEQLRYLLDDAGAQGDAEARRRWEAMVQRIAIERSIVDKANAERSSLRSLRSGTTSQVSGA